MPFGRGGRWGLKQSFYPSQTPVIWLGSSLCLWFLWLHCSLTLKHFLLFLCCRELSPRCWEIPSWWLSQHRLMRRRHRQLRCDESRLGSGGGPEGLWPSAPHWVLCPLQAGRAAVGMETSPAGEAPAGEAAAQRPVLPPAASCCASMRRWLRAAHTGLPLGAGRPPLGAGEATPLSERSRLATGGSRFSAMSCLRSRGQESLGRPP